MAETVGTLTFHRLCINTERSNVSAPTHVTPNTPINWGATYTPPKYVKAQQERDAVLLLEKRLEHFLQWLREMHDIGLCHQDAGMPVPLEHESQLIKQYVET